MAVPRTSFTTIPRLRLICTRGTPVAKMLAHSPPFPLIIDHLHGDHLITKEDEEGKILALQHNERNRRIRLLMPVPNSQRVVMALDNEFLMLEHLYIVAPTKPNTAMTLPILLRASHLRHLIQMNFAHLIRSPFFTSAIGLVTLSLEWIRPSAYYQPNELTRLLSLMPQLEILGIFLHSPIPNRDVERQLLHMPIMTCVTLPNLHRFGFKGAM